MRTKATAKDKLPNPEIRRFLECHVRYRLRLLRLGWAVYPPNCLMECAAFEAALVHGRHLIEFLGLGTNRDEFPPVLHEQTAHYTYKRNGRVYTDDVKLKNLGWII
jgi:hypothetical protein